jgi:hypothetical protein
VKKFLEWEQLALLTGASDEEVRADDDEEPSYRPEDKTDMRGIESHVVRKIVMEQKPWQDEESTVREDRQSASARAVGVSPTSIMARTK